MPTILDSIFDRPIFILKRFLFVVLSTGMLCHSKPVTAQVATDSVYTIIRELVNNKTKVTRTKALDAAAEWHCQYLIANKQTGHTEEDLPTLKTPMLRAISYGDRGNSFYEVCWAGTPRQIERTLREGIFYFNTSEKHWEIMTTKVSAYNEKRFGYSRLHTPEWDACVIIYSTGPESK